MSRLEFIAALTTALAWPVVVVIVALLFRRQVAALLARPFQRLKAGPVELVWDREIAEAEAELGETRVLNSSPMEGGRPSEHLAEVARISPAAAVVQAFTEVEGQLRRLLADAGLETGTASATQLARRALEADLVRPETVRAIEGIAVLRNLAAHGQDVELDEPRALDYLALADAVSYALSQESQRRATRDPAA